ncbi:MAG: hypothetical protein EHM48_03285 [Planctomycetaceae bacterium]|nr:MAG: hypothetical protein EHM48_03285 [Planctomycetaceae bacterium]
MESKTARGHEEPHAIQFSIFLANRVGQLKDLMNLFAQQHVEVLGVSIVDSSDWGVVRAVFSDAGKARCLLQKHNTAFTESSVLLAEFTDQAALSDICACLVSAEISVNFAYPLVIRSHENPVMVLHVDDTVLATQVLTMHRYILLGSEDLADPGHPGQMCQ